MASEFEQKMKQEQIALENKSRAFGVVFVVAALAALVFGYNACSSEDTEPVSEIDALIHSRDCVKKQLKSPSTAAFAPLAESTVIKTNDSTFTVLSWVDSQNSYGAMLRNAYTCTVVYSQGFKYVACKDVAIL